MELFINTNNYAHSSCIVLEFQFETITNKTYMYIMFQQNRVSRSVKTVQTYLFAKNCKLHKFATCNSNFEKSLLSDMNHIFIHI